MTHEQFAQWRKYMGWTKTLAAKQLGLSRRTIEYYENGTHSVPRHIHLACLALKHGVRLDD